MAKLTGNKTLSGTHGEVWWDGERIAEISKVEVKISANREDIQLGMSVDSKLTGLKGEITMTMTKAFTRSSKVLKDYMAGKDTRYQIITKLADPDATAGQQERVVINNVWFNDLPVTAFEKGGKCEEELSGGFTPEDVKWLDEIKVK